MITLLFTLATTFVLLTVCGLFIGYSKRRRDGNRDRAAGGCQGTAGERSGCCSDIVLPGKNSCCGDHQPHTCRRR